jgi:hypothetical protein
MLFFAFHLKASSLNALVCSISHAGAKSIAPEGCSCQELAMRGAGFDDQSRVDALLLPD